MAGGAQIARAASHFNRVAGKQERLALVKWRFVKRVFYFLLRDLSFWACHSTLICDDLYCHWLVSWRRMTQSWHFCFRDWRSARCAWCSANRRRWVVSELRRQRILLVDHGKSFPPFVSWYREWRNWATLQVCLNRVHVLRHSVSGQLLHALFSRNAFYCRLIKVSLGLSGRCASRLDFSLAFEVVHSTFAMHHAEICSQCQCQNQRLVLFEYLIRWCFS